jgi:hypothetical protein
MWTGGNMTDQHNILTNDISGTLYRYLYIDHGAQFRVYAILANDGTPTGRVVKVPLDFTESKYVLTPYFSEAGIPEAEADRRIHRLMLQKQQLPELLQGIYAASPQLMNLLGNLKIVPILARPIQPEHGYFMPLHLTQDHVTPMAEYLHPFRFAEMPPQRITIQHVHRVRQVMRAIIDLHYRLWEYGIMETTFKLENIGVIAKSNKVILVDAGEYTLKQHEAETIINEKKWRHALSTEKIDHLYLPTILHKEYSELCNTALTIEAVRKHWNKRSRTIERRASQRIKIRERLTHDPQKELALWIKQQTLHSNLHSGVPKERIENMLISHADLTMLLEDKRLSIMPLTEIELQERAERDLANSQPANWQEIYRHLPFNEEV